MLVTVWMPQHVYRCRCGRGGMLGDDVGHLFQATAMDREKAETRTYLADLDHSGFAQ